MFVPGCAVALNEECELIVPAGAEELRVAALVCSSTPRAPAEAAVRRRVKQKIAVLARESRGRPAAPEPAATAEPEPAEPPEQDTADDAAEDRSPAARNMHERLRGLTLVQQIKLARDGEVSERMILERMYGKNVWEPLLRNPRLTGPEVARIARMGALPRPLSS